MRKGSVLVGLILVSLMFFGVSNTLAATELITSRSDLGGNDFIDWGNAGTNGDIVSNPFSILSNGGITSTISKTSDGDFERLDQGSGWSGNFKQGDRLLWTCSSSPGSIVIDPSSLIKGGGAQIQSDYFGAFTANIEALDSGGDILGSYNLNSYSDSSNNNSAIFIGILSDNFNIDKILLNVTDASYNPGDYAINKFDMVKTSTTPEPATMSLLGLGLAGMLRFRKKEHKS